MKLLKTIQVVSKQERKFIVEGNEVTLRIHRIDGIRMVL